MAADVAAPGRLLHLYTSRSGSSEDQPNDFFAWLKDTWLNSTASHHGPLSTMREPIR